MRCGDATDPAHVSRLLDGARPLVMITDAPYGVGYDPTWRHTVDPSQRTAVGPVTNDDRADWSAAVALFPGTVVYAWHAGLHAATVAGVDRGRESKDGRHARQSLGFNAGPWSAGGILRRPRPDSLAGIP